jgi:hypothetical protein
MDNGYQDPIRMARSRGLIGSFGEFELSASNDRMNREVEASNRLMVLESNTGG